MKLFKHKSLMRLLYAVLLAIPLVSIISRVIYVQSNKNAYQSYYGKTINNYETTLLTNINAFNTNDQYIFNSGTFDIKDTVIPQGAYAYLITCTNVNIISTNINNLPSEINSFSPYLDNTGKLNIRLNNDNNYLFGLSTYYLVFDFYYVSDNLTYNFAYNNIFSKITYNSYSFLDNVFEYSVDTIIQENNFGKVDFLSWFANMFLDNNNQVNNRYLGFANWYMNYIMFVSCAYLLFLVLMWFINFARRLLDRGMNYDW